MPKWSAEIVRTAAQLLGTDFLMTRRSTVDNAGVELDEIRSFLLVPGEIRYGVSNGYGSTNNKINRWTNIDIDNGNGVLDRTQSAIDGDDIEALVDCIVWIDGAKDFNANGLWGGCSKNSAQLTTSFSSITATDRESAQVLNGANFIYSICGGVVLSAGDKLRWHTTGAAAGANNAASFFHVKALQL